MSFRDDLLSVLSGGLPALIDGPSPTGTQPDPEPERIAPEPQLADREPFLMRVTQSQILIGTAAVIGALALVMVARR